MLKRCGVTKDIYATKAHPIFQVNKPQRQVYAPLSGSLKGGDQNLYTKVSGAPQLN
jgi:hypothetical protein